MLASLFIFFQMNQLVSFSNQSELCFRKGGAGRGGGSVLNFSFFSIWGGGGGGGGFRIECKVVPNTRSLEKTNVSLMVVEQYLLSQCI
jgi:hypothetical protein